MESERIKLFPEELPSGKKFKVRKIRSLKRARALFSLVFCVLIFALGFAFSEALKNGTIDLPEFFHSVNGTTSTSKVNEEEATIPDDDGGKYDINTVYDFDYSLVKDGELAVIPLDLSLSEYGDTYVYNDTSFNIDFEELLKKEDFLPAVADTDEPLVLIIHTHTSEAYMEEGKISCSESEEYARSSNEEENVIAVGKVIADILNENGIKTLHSTTAHDAESYKDSYARSAETVKYYLNKYPTIKYVFDIHRDSIVKSTGEIVRPVTVVDGETVAQVMCVVGTDQVGAIDYEWENNLSLALSLRASLNAKYTNMARGTCLRPSAYNQQLAPVSLLLEIGAGGNSLSEAKAAAELVALELVELIKR